MKEQIRVAGTVARDPRLFRIELAYLGFTMTEYATWVAILVYAYASTSARSRCSATYRGRPRSRRKPR